MSQIRGRVLLLNADFTTLGTVSVARAIRLTMREENPVQVLEIVPNMPMGTGSGKHVDRPSVIRLKHYVPVSENRRLAGDGKKRMRIYMRDGYQCQYCSVRVGQPYKDEHGVKRTLTQKDLTLDHITPKSKGGSGHPTNLVTACKPCNTRKDDRNPEEARMPLKTAVKDLKDIKDVGIENIILCKYVEHRPEWFQWLEGKPGFVEAFERHLEMAA
jgi:5-methylcytosine-specific restriction endonuclease McrA